MLIRTRSARALPLRTSSRRAASFRPLLEPLESREVPATFTVAHLADDALAGSLRWAIDQANTMPGDDVIDFSVTGIIQLGSTLPSISSNVDIQGPGANVLTVRGNLARNDGIFTVGGGANVTISGLTITSGHAQDGGGILNSGVLTLNHSSVSGNRANDSGGGIFNVLGATLTLNHSTVSGNRAESEGGGIYNRTGSVTLNNSTVSGNEAMLEGGGLFNNTGASLTLNSSTVSGNDAIQGGGLAVFGPLSARNTIIAGNTAIVGPDLDGHLGSLGHNLIGNSNGGTGYAPTDLLNVDPRLGPLQDNGGPTFTHALLAGSPALDAGDPSFVPPPSTDQRGFARVVGGRIDIGAYEAQHIIDDGDPGFTVIGDWVTGWTGQGYQDDVSFSEAGDGRRIARWTFTGLTAGFYRVSATWSEHANRATNAPFTIRDGTSVLGTVRVNQERAPHHFTDNGRPWFNLGGVYSPTSGTLVVQLSNDADEYVIADAVRIEQLTMGPQVVDDGAAGFFATEGFSSFAGQGDEGDVSFAAPGTGEHVALWTFTVTPGVYRISATWSDDPNRATNAPFHIYDGDTFLGEVRLNQELAPDDFQEGGTWWEDLGDGVYRITGSELSVYLLDDANDYVIADAVRIEGLN